MCSAVEGARGGTTPRGAGRSTPPSGASTNAGATAAPGRASERGPGRSTTSGPSGARDRDTPPAGGRAIMSLPQCGHLTRRPDGGSAVSSRSKVPLQVSQVAVILFARIEEVFAAASVGGASCAEEPRPGAETTTPARTRLLDHVAVGASPSSSPCAPRRAARSGFLVPRPDTIDRRPRGPVSASGLEPHFCFTSARHRAMDRGRTRTGRSGRAVEGDGLENRSAERRRGFESLLLRRATPKKPPSRTRDPAKSFLAPPTKSPYMKTE